MQTSFLAMAFLQTIQAHAAGMVRVLIQIPVCALIRRGILVQIAAPRYAMEYWQPTQVYAAEMVCVRLQIPVPVQKIIPVTIVKY